MDRSFDILASEYRPMVATYLRTLGIDGHLAEDLAQETFLSAYRALHTFEEGGNFGFWLRGIARNKALTHWRSVRRRPLVIDSRVLEGVEEVFTSLDREAGAGDWWESRREALRQCLARLSNHLREAIEQVYLREQSLQAAADALGASRAAIGQRISRARGLIRDCIATKLNPDPQP